jgi:hypothetical protein
LCPCIIQSCCLKFLPNTTCYISFVVSFSWHCSLYSWCFWLLDNCFHELHHLLHYLCLVMNVWSDIISYPLHIYITFVVRDWLKGLPVVVVCCLWCESKESLFLCYNKLTSNDVLSFPKYFTLNIFPSSELTSLSVSSWLNIPPSST